MPPASASLGASRYNIPFLCHDNPRKTETQLWTLIQPWVYTSARMSHLRTVCLSTALRSFLRLPGESEFQKLGRLVEFIKHLQEQLGETYQRLLFLRNLFLDAFNKEPNWADLVARSLPSENALADVIELLLEARRIFGAPAPRTAPHPAPLLPPSPAFPASLDNLPALPPPLTDPVTGGTCVLFSDPEPADQAAVYWTMRQIRRGAPSHYATRRSTPSAPPALDPLAAATPAAPPTTGSLPAPTGLPLPAAPPPVPATPCSHFVPADPEVPPPSTFSARPRWPRTTRPLPRPPASPNTAPPRPPTT